MFGAKKSNRVSTTLSTLQPMKTTPNPGSRKFVNQTYSTPMERIAAALNVSQSTITEDLRNLSTIDKSKPAKSASNPKGAGRPKGSGRRQMRNVFCISKIVVARKFCPGAEFRKLSLQANATPGSYFGDYHCQIKRAANSTHRTAAHSAVIRAQRYLITRQIKKIEKTAVPRVKQSPEFPFVAYQKKRGFY
jgi:hypothetical protein